MGIPEQVVGGQWGEEGAPVFLGGPLSVAGVVQLPIRWDPRTSELAPGLRFHLWDLLVV